MQVPKPKKIPKLLSLHNDERIDPYYWMNDRDNEEVMHHLKNENDYCDSVLAHTKPLQSEIYQEIVNRIKPNDDSTPYVHNGYAYQSRYQEGFEHPVYYRKPIHHDYWDTLLDAQKMSQPYDYFKVGSIDISPNNGLAAYSTDITGRRLYTIQVKELNNDSLLEDRIEQTTGSVAWANDKTFFYTKKDEQTLRPNQIWKHTLGASEDELIYEEKDETFYTVVFESKTRQFIIIASHSTLSSEYRLIDVNDPSSKPRIFQEREEKHEYEIVDGGHEFYILTNWNAENFRVMRCPLDRTRKESWQECIPHRVSTFIDEIEVTKDYLAVLSRSEAVPDIDIYDRDNNHLYQIGFPEQARMLYFVHNYEYNNKHIRLGYCSLTTPYSTYDFFPFNQTMELRKQQEVLGGYDPNAYQSERIHVQSADGVLIPVSLVYNKSLFNPGTNPCLLYGYGSYGFSLDPYFSIPRISLLDRGFVYAIAHIRGGQELGRKWYEDGKMLKKQNTFSDFIQCGRALVAKSYSAPNLLCAMGGSAGGLLIGAVINQAPELWKAVIAAVPFVDVLTTMLDETIPLTTGEYSEWGNPNNFSFYEYIKAYSPYDNIKEQAYPAVLVTTGFHDSQVQYWEPTKWIAKLREHNTSGRPVVFHIDLEAGHSGKAGRYKKHKETALEWAFLIDQTIGTNA